MEPTAVGDYKLGKLVIEGKTKKVYEIEGNAEQVILVSKDRITAGDGVKAHDLKGKATISNLTNSKVFQLLNTVGMKTSFVKTVSDNAFLAEKCEMIPIEWVTRRLATGSFLKRHPGVPEGYRFCPPKQETFFKDDANHDPQWSEEQIISANFVFNGVRITRDEVDIMRRTTIVVFEVLEKAWASRNCALIDMKIEFGINKKGEIVVADVIDSDSWRLWPSGDKRLMKDKQVYRNLANVTEHDLETIKNNFQWIADQMEQFIPPSQALVVVMMGSPSDEAYCRKIEKCCLEVGVECEVRVCSAHKGTEETLKVASEYEGGAGAGGGGGRSVVLVAVAGRSNGLGPVLSANTTLPVINAPPLDNTNVDRDLWSSLSLPSGLGCCTVLSAEGAALMAAQIHSLNDHVLWATLRVRQLSNFISLKKADRKMRAK